MTSTVCIKEDRQIQMLLLVGQRVDLYVRTEADVGIDAFLFERLYWRVRRNLHQALR